jgi:hypothetical protein
MLLSPLSAAQMLEVERAFTWYLLRAINYKEAAARCEQVLDADQIHLKVVIKKRLSEMKDDYDCNALFKPALIRLAAGDDTLFRQMKTPSRRSASILKSDPKAVRVCLKQVAYPIAKIGKTHIEFIEAEHMPLIEPHAFRHVSKHAKFLTMGDSGITIEDMVNDLKLIALSAVRWYYPFRKGLHLTNTIRLSITNRGRTMVTYNVAPRRQRVSMDGNYKMVNREVGGKIFDIAADTHADKSLDATDSGKVLNLDIAEMAKGPRVSAAKVARFIQDPVAQDLFIDWLKKYSAKAAEAPDIPTAVRIVGLPYSRLLSEYLQAPRVNVVRALSRLRRMAV